MYDRDWAERYESNRFRRGMRWAAGAVIASTLVAAVLPVLDGNGVSGRTAIGRVVAAAAGGDYAHADEIPHPAASTSPAADVTGSPSPVSSRSPESTGAAAAAPQPPPPDGRTLFGASPDFTVGGGFSNWVGRADDRFGTLPVVRAFNPAFPRPWPQSDAVAGRAVVVSFKAHPQRVSAGHLDEQLREWFAGAPDSGEIYWNYHHEPEDDIARGDFTAEEFRAAWKHIHGIAEQVGKDNQFATLILRGATADPKSEQDFQDYYPGDRYVDVLGWDTYNVAHRQGRYAAPKEMFDRAIALSGRLGKPWGIAAIGSVIVDGDDGSARAAWLGRVGTYLNDRGALWVTYLDSNIGGDYRLDDEKSRRAWAELVRAGTRG